MTVAPIDTPTDTEPVDIRCRARTKRGPCRNRPIRGASVCRAHGGAAPQVRAAAAARLLEAEVRQLFGQVYDDQPITDPLTAFAMVSGKVVAFMRVAENLMAELSSPGYVDNLGVEQVRAKVQLFERSLDRCSSHLATHARLNIDTRLAAIEAAKAAMVMKAWERAAAVAGVTGARAIEAGRVFAAELRLIDGEDRHGAP